MVSGAGDDVCNLFGSSVRTKVLLSLYGGVKTRKHLKEALGCSPQSVSIQAKWLGEKGLLERRGKGRYRLTLSGRAMAFKLMEVRKLYRAIEKHHDFWAAHEVEAIPEARFYEIGTLSSGMVLEAGATPDSTQRTITEAFKNAHSKIIGISPVVTLEWARATLEQAEQGVEISLITTEEVLEMLHEKEFSKYNLLNHPNIALKTTTDLRLAFLCNMESVALALFKEGELDIYNILACKGRGAVEWGIKLFGHFESKSTAPVR